MDPYEKEIQRLQKLYEEVCMDGEIEESDNDSIADPDFVRVSNHDTDTEQDSTTEDEEVVKKTKANNVKMRNPSLVTNARISLVRTELGEEKLSHPEILEFAKNIVSSARGNW